MKNKSMVKMALVAFSFMMAFSFGAYAQKTDCTKMTDVEIVDVGLSSNDSQFSSLFLRLAYLLSICMRRKSGTKVRAVSET